MYQSVTSVPRLYYAATAGFLLLDYGFDINVRLAFLEPWPVWRAFYYLFCFACLGLIIWRPRLQLAVTTVESLITISALILSMGVRAIGMSVGALEAGAAAVITVQEVINFLIAGFAAWLGWTRGMQALVKNLRR